MEIYTLHYNPWVFGGSVWQTIKTEVEVFEKISLGKGHYGLLIKNPVKDLWHIAEEKCGAIIGTDKSKVRLIKKTKKDVLTGDKKVMKEQIAKGKEDLSNAKLLSQKDFFSKFGGPQ
jgi:uncharacterized ubiquitin-like protein YukD